MKSTLAVLICLAFPLAANERPERDAARDLRVLATALESRAADTNEYPDVTLEALIPMLEPTYTRLAPRVDPWGTPYAYVADGRNYRFVSAGADGRFEPASRELDAKDETPRPMDGLDADIIFQNGTFLQYPKSIR